MRRKFVVLTVLMAVALVVLSACGEDKAIRTIKSATMTEFPTQTIGEAFAHVYQQVEWTASRTKGSDTATVWCKGTVLYGDEPTRLYIGFELNEKTREFTVSDMLLDNVPLSNAMQIKMLCDIYDEDSFEMLVSRIERDIQNVIEIAKKMKQANVDEKNVLLDEFNSIIADVQDISQIFDDDDLNPSQKARLESALWELALL